MFIRIGGEGSSSVVVGRMGTGVQVVEEGGRISRPGWDGRSKGWLVRREVEWGVQARRVEELGKRGIVTE